VRKEFGDGSRGLAPDQRRAVQMGPGDSSIHTPEGQRLGQRQKRQLDNVRKMLVTMVDGRAGLRLIKTR